MFLLLTKNLLDFSVATTDLHPSPTFPVALPIEVKGLALATGILIVACHEGRLFGTVLEGLRTRERHAEDTTGWWQLKDFVLLFTPEHWGKMNLYFDGRIFFKGVETTNPCFLVGQLCLLVLFFFDFWYHGISPLNRHLGDFFVGDFKKSRGGRGGFKESPWWF